MSRIIYNIRDMKGGGIVDNGYTKRIRERVLSLEDGTVFVMSDFADIADTSTIRQSLSRLVQSGILRRILKGVYEKPKYSKLLDEYVAADPEAVANALARSYHWTIAPCGNTALNLLGLSTQVTAVWSYISDDLYRMAATPVKEAAFSRLDLLKKVVDFKMIFYPRAWAKYPEAVPGTLKLLPPEYRFAALEADYNSMQDMLYGDVPTFETVIAAVRELEKEINTL